MKVEVSAKDFFADIDTLLLKQDVKIKVTGHSMWPFFKDRKTVVTLSKVTKIKKGDVYLFIYNSSYVLHRLIKVKGDKLIFRGDGNVIKEEVMKPKVLAVVKSYHNKKEINTTKFSYKLRVCLYRMLPRRITLKLFKR